MNLELALDVIDSATPIDVIASRNLEVAERLVAAYKRAVINKVPDAALRAELLAMLNGVLYAVMDAIALWQVEQNFARRFVKQTLCCQLRESGCVSQVSEEEEQRLIEVWKRPFTELQKSLTRELRYA